MNATLTEAKRLHDLGFAVHWLKPKSKAPVESGWTRGARKTWKELKDTYVAGMNVGVRLGAASKIGGKYLGVIDCDVKSTAPKHKDEMAEKLDGLKVPKLPPVVASGRGNGSCHLYVLTDEPLRPQRYSQSGESVKVRMPSAGKPSKRETEELTGKELADGWRLRPAWEISIMGEGQQVVLPPSIHPDTGKPYVWAQELKEASDVPSLDFAQGAAHKPVVGRLDGFKPIEVDLVGSELTADIVDLILTGRNCNDRSAGLFRASIAMVKLGMTDAEILSVLTEPGTYLGDAAYEHTQSQSRETAANWVNRYTLEKVRREHDAVRQFADEVEVTDLPEAELAQIHATVTDVGEDWEQKIETSGRGGAPKNTAMNCRVIFENAAAPNIFIRDEFVNADIYGAPAPWGGRVGEELRDSDVVRMKMWMASKFSFEPSNDRIEDALQSVAMQNAVHPVREHLKALPSWDGVPRLDNWLFTYCGAVGPKEYVQAIGRKTLCAMIARVMEPGCKFDQMLILEGEQNKGKSTTIRILATDKWFSDAFLDVSSKDAVSVMHSVWVLEIGELTGQRKSDANQFKQFLSQQTDRARLAYKRRAENYPRQCIFIGTTNLSTYAKDVTGNRRLWPVEVTDCKLDDLRRDRDQLFAEAMVAYSLGEALYLDDPVTQAQALAQQADRMEEDHWVELIADWIEAEEAKAEFDAMDTERIQTRDLFKMGGPLQSQREDLYAFRRAGDCLRRLGFERKKLRPHPGSPKRGVGPRVDNKVWYFVRKTGSPGP